MSSPGMSSPGMRSPRMSGPGMSSPELSSPGMRSPGMSSPGMSSSRMSSLWLRGPGLCRGSTHRGGRGHAEGAGDAPGGLETTNRGPETTAHGARPGPRRSRRRLPRLATNHRPPAGNHSPRGEAGTMKTRPNLDNYPGHHTLKK